jgi:hypothetical protein
MHYVVSPSLKLKLNIAIPDFGGKNGENEAKNK